MVSVIASGAASAGTARWPPPAVELRCGDGSLGDAPTCPVTCIVPRQAAPHCIFEAQLEYDREPGLRQHLLEPGVSGDGSILGLQIGSAAKKISVAYYDGTLSERGRDLLLEEAVLFAESPSRTAARAEAGCCAARAGAVCPRICIGGRCEKSYFDHSTSQTASR